jgi:hypothetical protein
MITLTDKTILCQEIGLQEFGNIGESPEESLPLSP